jgi:hypothetical protein
MKKGITSPFDVKSHAIACKVLNKDPKKVTSVHDQQDDIANAINKLDKFKPSFKKPEQQKWTPWMVVDSSGFRFADSDCDDSGSGTVVGSRLCLRFRTREISDFFGKQFIALHKKAYNK